MLGIFGGTFDPIHYGHLSAAWQALQFLQLDELRFMPCHKPAHRTQPLINTQHRLAMLKLAIANTPGFAIDERELNSDNISYTVNSLESIRKEVGDTPICLLMSIETFYQLHTWHQPERLLQLAHLVIVNRPNTDFITNDFLNALLNHEVKNPQMLKTKSHGQLYFANTSALDISASAIRAMFSQNLNPRFLLPDAVLAYIQENQLYKCYN